MRILGPNVVNLQKEKTQILNNTNKSISFIRCHIAMPHMSQQAGWDNFTVLVTDSHAHCNPTYCMINTHEIFSNTFVTEYCVLSK